MVRELNKGLFGEDFKMSDMAQTTESHNLNVPDKRIRELVAQIKKLQMRVVELEKGQRVQSSKIQEASGTHQRVQALMTQMNQFVKEAIQGMNSKISVVSGKIRENAVNERKTQELIERHNQIVQKFEVRIDQMQKIISEQQLKLAGYESMLKQRSSRL